LESVRWQMGVIVGSACVKAVGGSENPVDVAREFAAEFRRALIEVSKYW
jgi:hypothetical protein